MTLQRKDNVYSIENLPPLKYKNIKFGNGLTSKQGDIISRGIIGDTKILKHYGIIHGMDSNNTLWIIENNRLGIQCVTLRDFLNNKSQISITSTPPTVTYSEILKRAKERMYLPYDARVNNCEHFVNYAVNNLLESQQSKNTQRLFDIFLSTMEGYVYVSSNTPNEFKQTIKESSDKIRTHLELPRHETLNNIRLLYIH